MKEQRWLRIIPIALIMYTISYVDRTNVNLALNQKLSSMWFDLKMDEALKGLAAGIFFLGYVALQIPGGHLAMRWSARKVVALCLIGWGICAVGCGLSQTYTQFAVMRFFLGMAESAVYPATLVLLYHWFPRPERARATAYWSLCQPLAVAGSAPVTAWLLGKYDWHQMLILEGILPFLWLPLWWFCIRDHPREAKWISSEELKHIETTLRDEAVPAETVVKIPILRQFGQPVVFVMVLFYFLHNCAAYGCMTFFADTMDGQNFTKVQKGWLFAVPYAITAVIMVLVSWSSDRTRERRMHAGLVYAVSGICLILSVAARGNFWVSFAFMCLAIPGPFAGMSPFWANASETLPRHVLAMVVGLVNAVGNLGGFIGPYFTGWMKRETHSTAAPFIVLGIGMLGCTVLAFFLPKAPVQARAVLHTRPIPPADTAV